MVREAAKKVLILMDGPLRGGWGLRAGPLRKKELFWNLFIPTFVPTAIKLEWGGGGGFGLMGRAIRGEGFF